MTIIKDIEFSILVDGEKLKEHDTHEENDNNISTYVEAQEDKSYVFQYKFDNKNIERLAFSITIDGKPAYWGSNTNSGTVETCGTWLDDSTYERQTFMFGKLISDSDPVQYEAHPEVCKNVGTIKIEVWRAKREGILKSVAKGSNKRRSLEAPKVFDEKTIKGKGIDYQTNYKSTQIERERKPGLTITYIDTPREPFATFHFMYRSRKNLQSKGCIPMSLSPEPEDDDCIITGSSTVANDKKPMSTTSESKLFEKMQSLQSEVESLRKLLKDESQESDQGNGEGPSRKRRRISISDEKILAAKKQSKNAFAIKSESSTKR